MGTGYPKINSLKTVGEFRAQWLKVSSALGAGLTCDDEILTAERESPLAQPLEFGDSVLGNRFVVHPMEGWDGNLDGTPSEKTLRRWQRFGLSGAKLIWGGEAFAVQLDARANPNQILGTAGNREGLDSMLHTLLTAHHERFGTTDDLVIGFQLTHSGRFCKPNDKFRMEPRVAFRHPILDRKFNVTSDSQMWTDAEIEELIQCYIRAARIAREAGADFVDIKHCHGYLLHEFLGAHTRPGKFGGSFENRTRILREIAAGIRAEGNPIDLGVRLSAFDFLPYKMGEDKIGIPETYEGQYPYGFGTDEANPLAIDLTETKLFFALLESLDIKLVCVTAGSPYYNPHIQRPALFPPSDGYLPPEDPLCGVARQLAVTAQLKAAFPNLCVVGSGYTYLQEWLPHVAQHQVRTGQVDFVGLGRLVLSYHDLPFDLVNGRALQTKRICRTFSDCTTGPRNGLISGCFPLDKYYKEHPHAALLKAAKA